MTFSIEIFHEFMIVLIFFQLIQLLNVARAKSNKQTNLITCDTPQYTKYGAMDTNNQQNLNTS